MKIFVDPDRCSGHGRCYALAPEIFVPDEEGYVKNRGVDIDVAPADEEKARLAIVNCPEQAIRALD